MAAINDPNRAARLQSQLEEHPTQRGLPRQRSAEIRPGRDESMRSPGFEAEWLKGDSRCKKDCSRGDPTNPSKPSPRVSGASRPMPSGPISIPAPTSNRIGGTRIAQATEWLSNPRTIASARGVAECGTRLCSMSRSSDTNGCTLARTTRELQSGVDSAGCGG